ncbi:hypothetical protein AVEN_267309-1 [Araneus ventricosus]|uniref:Uncharacterized protein n=1 Tax=Araneus ventricosus TaxID=182803 RepID=A0A4Y2DM59_ARAVE|nr:hypothetical protein AVEN_267309-1 [Araneus ventricosus]
MKIAFAANHFSSSLACHYTPNGRAETLNSPRKRSHSSAPNPLLQLRIVKISAEFVDELNPVKGVEMVGTRNFIFPSNSQRLKVEWKTQNKRNIASHNKQLFY